MKTMRSVTVLVIRSCPLVVVADDHSSRSWEDKIESPVVGAEHGALDASGRYYPPMGRGFMDPSSGTVFAPAAGGFVNTRTGEYIPTDDR
jgi:hypothetical protein